MHHGAVAWTLSPASNEQGMPNRWFYCLYSIFTTNDKIKLDQVITFDLHPLYDSPVWHPAGRTIGPTVNSQSRETNLASIQRQ